MSCQQNAGEYRNIHIDNSLSNVANLKCLVMALTNQIYMHEQIKDRPNSGSLLPLCPESSDLPVTAENMKINTYRTVIFSVAIYGCDIWSVTLKWSIKGRMCENRMHRKAFDSKTEQVVEGFKKLHDRILHEIYFL